MISVLSRARLSRTSMISLFIAAVIVVAYAVGLIDSHLGAALGAVITGQRITYGYNNAATTYDGANEAIDISGALDTLSPTEVPMLLRIGRDSLRDPATQVKHEWLEDEVRGISTTTTDTDIIGATTSPARVTVVTGDGTKFRGSGNGGSPATYSAAAAADIVRISSGAGEELAVVSQQVDANTIDVVRGYFSGSAAVSHTTSATITIVGTMQVQGLTTVGTSRTTIKANKFNYTQIFEDSYTASATQIATDKFTMSNDQAYQLGNITKVMGQQMNNAMLFGYKQAPAANAPGALGGIRSFLVTNVYDKAGAALTQAAWEDALQAVWQAGAQSKVAFVNATQKRRINTFLDPYRMVGYSDKTLGTAVERYNTDFGSVDVVLDRNMPTNEVLILDTDRIGFGPLKGRALGTSPITVLSREAQVWEVSGEYTVEVRQEKAHAQIKNLATTGLF